VVQAVLDQYSGAIKILKAKGINIDIKEADLTLKISSVSTANLGITVLIVNPSTKPIQTKTTSVTFVLSKEPSTLGGTAHKLTADNKLRDLIVTEHLGKSRNSCNASCSIKAFLSSVLIPGEPLYRP
jgi:hypothetical protein